MEGWLAPSHLISISTIQKATPVNVIKKGKRWWEGVGKKESERDAKDLKMGGVSIYAVFISVRCVPEKKVASLNDKHAVLIQLTEGSDFILVIEERDLMSVQRSTGTDMDKEKSLTNSPEL
jgi:hypothetical protein